MAATATVKIEQTALKDIKPYKQNPRDNSTAVDVVLASIKEFGFLVPIVVDGKMEIVAGHTRWAAAKKLKLKTVPVIKATHLTPAQVRAFRVIDNRASEFADWKHKELHGELAFLQGEGLVLTPLGFDGDDLAHIAKLAAEADRLPAVVVAGEAEPEDRVTKEVLRKPKSVQIKVGVFVFHIPTAEYEAWEAKLREANGFDEARVIAALAKKLGLVYDKGAGQSTPVQKAPAKRTRKR